jgi:hypothetical protein
MLHLISNLQRLWPDDLGCCSCRGTSPLNLLNWQTDIDLGMGPHDGYGRVRSCCLVNDVLLGLNIVAALHPMVLQQRMLSTYSGTVFRVLFEFAAAAECAASGCRTITSCASVKLLTHRCTMASTKRCSARHSTSARCGATSPPALTPCSTPHSRPLQRTPFTLRWPWRMIQTTAAPALNLLSLITCACCLGRIMTQGQ